MYHYYRHAYGATSLSLCNHFAFPLSDILPGLNVIVDVAGKQYSQRIKRSEISLLHLDPGVRAEGYVPRIRRQPPDLIKKLGWTGLELGDIAARLLLHHEPIIMIV